jgi:hypothetical protein
MGRRPMGTVIFNAPAPLTQAERAMLPERMRYADCARYSSDCFDNREAELDAICEARAWIAANMQMEAA